MPTPTSLPLAAVRFTGGVLGERVEMVGSVTLRKQWAAINDRIPGAAPSHAVRNFRIAAGDEAGKYDGLWFQDSDVAKWLEAACYRISFAPEEILSAAISDLVDRHFSSFLEQFGQQTRMSRVEVRNEDIPHARIFACCLEKYLEGFQTTC